MKHILLILIFAIVPIKAQCIIRYDSLTVASDSFLIMYEDTLSVLMEQLHDSKNTSEKNQINHLITQHLKQVFTDTLSFFYPFERLAKLGKIYSPDSMLRIYTWNIAYARGTYGYAGAIQQLDIAGGSYAVFMLTHNHEIILNSDTIYPSEQWYGALYYDILLTKCAEKKLYTLLGVNFNNLFTSRKIIDVLDFSSSGQPVFGKPIFFSKGQLTQRIIFEYSARVTMSLKYNQKMNMIVFDHLSPSQSKYTGKYEFYGPDFSYDGYRYANCRWIFEEDIDARNR